MTFSHNKYTLYTSRKVCISFQISTFLGSPERHPSSLRECWWFLRGVLMAFLHNEYPLYTSRKVCISFQISIFLWSALTPGFSRSSSKESKRTLVVPERSLDGFWHNEYPVYTSRKVCINCQIFTFLRSGLTPGFSRASAKESKRTLVVPERSLDGFWHNEYP